MLRIKNILIASVMLFIANGVISQATTLYSNNFESSSTGYITSTNENDPVWKYEWNAHSGCSSTDLWRIGTTGGYDGSNSNITGNYASIDYGSQSCVQDVSFATQEFTATQSSINIEFDWAFRQYTGSYLKVVLYNDVGAAIETLLNVTGTGSGTYTGNIDVTANEKYSVDFRYYGTWDYGAQIDNITITEMAAGYTETTIGTGTSESALVPAYGYYDYSWSQMIYTQAELNTAGTIKSISFYVDNSSPSSYTMNNQKIFLGHTSASQFDGSPAEDVTSDITVTNYTECFSGSITFVHGWTTVTLDQDFPYNNASNLVVKLENRDGTYASPYPAFDYTTSSNKAAYKYNDGSYPTGNGTRTSIRPNVRFMFYSGGGALPITLISFTGEVIEDISPYALLNWKVASQINNDYFSILHSLDGYNWKEIGRRDGAGNTNIELDYEFLDNEIQQGWNYYKLRQTDYDGNFEEFNAISLKPKEPKTNIIKVINQMGQEISEDTKGIHINIWNNGEVTKTINHK